MHVEPVPQTSRAQTTRTPVIIIFLILAAVTLAIYWQTGNHEFLSYDDPAYVTENVHVASGLTLDGLTWAITSFDAANWHPLTWLSHMADVHLYGMNPRGHHLTNVIVHTASSLLLLLLLLRVTGALWRSSFVAALFALHPLHVESVAWVAERKDVISAFFWFLTLLLYAGYAASSKRGLYLLSLASFVLGLMAKPMLVTLPLIMCLMDIWPLQRYGRDGGGREPRRDRAVALVKEKLPFLACALVSGIITILAQHAGGATRTLAERSLLLRTENALVAYVKYMIKTLWPRDLAVLYPIPSSFPLWQVAGSLLVLIVISAAVIRFRDRFPYLCLGWFWFLITLVPVIGLLQVGDQSMADRYTYIPAIGLFVMVAWGVPDLCGGLRNRKRILGLAAGAAIIASAVLTWHQLGYWRDSISLYRRALEVTSGNASFYDNLGMELVEKGELDAGIQALRTALSIKPDLASAHYNLGLALDRKGDLNAAIEEYLAALRLNSPIKKIHNNLGVALAKSGDIDAAIQVFREAIRVHPDDVRAQENLSIALEQKRIQARSGK